MAIPWKHAKAWTPYNSHWIWPFVQIWFHGTSSKARVLNISNFICVKILSCEAHEIHKGIKINSITFFGRLQPTNYVDWKIGQSTWI